MQALNTAATARGYSPTIGETSCEQLTNKPGAIRSDQSGQRLFVRGIHRRP